MDYSGQKFLQKCGDYLIIDRKSTKKVRNRYYWEAHFEGYSKKLYVRVDSFKYGTVGNPEKPDENGFLCDLENVDKNIYFVWKDMEKRCYDKKDTNYSNYGALGVSVSEEFKKFSYFYDWYMQNTYDCDSLEIDKDCLSGLLDLENKMYSKNTCILIPSSINTFLSTLGKGIYLTKAGTFCVRLRRKLLKVNKNFKSYEEAVNFKKDKDIEYLNILLEENQVPSNIKKYLFEYVKIFKYSSDI